MPIEILNIFTTIENFLSLYENIINFVNIGVTLLLTCLIIQLTKKIANIQTGIQAKQCITERQQILKPLYKAFLEIKQLSEDLLYYIGNDLLTIMDEKSSDTLHLTRQEIQKQTDYIKENEIIFQLNFPQYRNSYKKAREYLYLLNHIALHLECLQKTFNPSVKLNPDNIEQYLYINLDRLEDTYYNMQNRHPDICHAFECCEKPKAITAYDLKRIRRVIYNDLINLWQSKDCQSNEDERLENIHKMLDCIENSNNGIIAILKQLMQLKEELYIEDDILGAITKECTYTPLKI